MNEPMEIDFRQSAEIGELAAALVKAQGVMKPAVKSAKNPFFKTNYADLGAVKDVIQKPFADNGLAVIQGAFNMGDGRILVRTRLLHSSGQWIESGLFAEAKDMGPQAVGSVITYLRRYGVSGMAGVSTEDDDGEGAERPAAQPARDAAPARPPAQTWKKPAQALPMKPNPPAQAPLVCDHGVAHPNRCLECAAHEETAK